MPFRSNHHQQTYSYYLPKQRQQQQQRHRQQHQHQYAGHSELSQKKNQSFRPLMQQHQQQQQQQQPPTVPPKLVCFKPKTTNETIAQPQERRSHTNKTDIRINNKKGQQTQMKNPNILSSTKDNITSKVTKGSKTNRRSKSQGRETDSPTEVNNTSATNTTENKKCKKKNSRKINGAGKNSIKIKHENPSPLNASDFPALDGQASKKNPSKSEVSTQTLKEDDALKIGYAQALLNQP
jgi:hypothetical protein